MFGSLNGPHHDRRVRTCPRSSIDSASVWTRVVVVANRAPFRHEHDANGHINVKRSASGLVTALEPLVAACSGTWVAHAAGSADASAANEHGVLGVPATHPRYRVRYVPLADDEHRGYYYGFANEGLWPLCHSVHVKPVFRSGDFQMYRSANARFAAAVGAEAAGERPLVLVQDYHFALAPRMIRDRLSSGTVVAFWHIPWPNPRVFRTCPWAAQLLEGLLGSDIVGLQTPEDCAHFLEGADTILGQEATCDWQSVTYRGRTTRVRAYPVGIEWENRAVQATPRAHTCRERVCRALDLPSDVQLGIGVDRLDYTKGIHEKFLAVERLLELVPSLQGRFVFVQAAEPSRDCLAAYRDARAQVRATSDRINARFGREGWTPIRLLEAHYEPVDVYTFYRAADVCYVASLDDGMNLVAKEFVCARDDERGVLVLSEFAGAAQQLDAALIVNPYAVDDAAGALAQALRMSRAEQGRRLRRLRANVATFDSRWWTHQLLHDAASVDHARALPVRGVFFGEQASA